MTVFPFDWMTLQVDLIANLIGSIDTERSVTLRAP